MSQEARKVARNFLSMNIAFSKCRPTENCMCSLSQLCIVEFTGKLFEGFQVENYVFKYVNHLSPMLANKTYLSNNREAKNSV